MFISPDPALIGVIHEFFKMMKGRYVFGVVPFNDSDFGDAREFRSNGIDYTNLSVSLSPIGIRVVKNLRYSIVIDGFFSTLSHIYIPNLLQIPINFEEREE